jgi:hypothetical protein
MRRLRQQRKVQQMNPIAAMMSKARIRIDRRVLREAIEGDETVLAAVTGVIQAGLLSDVVGNYGQLWSRAQAIAEKLADENSEIEGQNWVDWAEEHMMASLTPLAVVAMTREIQLMLPALLDEEDDEEDDDDGL